MVAPLRRRRGRRVAVRRQFADVDVDVDVNSVARRARMDHPAPVPAPSASVIARSEPKIAQRWVIVRPAAEWPMIFAVAFLDGKVIDTRKTKPHQAMLIEFPVFVAVAAEPIPAVVMTFIGKTYGNAVLVERPEFLDQAIVEFTAPLARQECFDLLAALQEFRAVSPPAVRCVGKGDARRVAGIPGIFGHAHFLSGGFGSERRKRWATHRTSSVYVAGARP